MIITTQDELSAYLPTNLVQSEQTLLPLMQLAEDTYIRPILGAELYMNLGEMYQLMKEDYPDGIYPGMEWGEEETDDTQVKYYELLKLCQRATVYYAMANNAGILGVSVNGGNGLASVETDGMKQADKEAVNRFERDCFMNARRAVELLLLYLEEDAREEEPIFKAWKESCYFYQHGDLLFTTATDLCRFMGMDCDRAKFVQQVADIRFCQDNYLAPRFGDEFLEAVIASETSAAFKEDAGVDTKKWARLKVYLKTALAMYIDGRKPEKQRQYNTGDAELAMSRAVGFFQGSQDAFGEYGKLSPLYVEPTPEPEPPTEEELKRRECERKWKAFDNSRHRENAIFVMGGVLPKH